MVPIGILFLDIKDHTVASIYQLPMHTGFLIGQTKAITFMSGILLEKHQQILTSMVLEEHKLHIIHRFCDM